MTCMNMTYEKALDICWKGFTTLEGTCAEHEMVAGAMMFVCGIAIGFCVPILLNKIKIGKGD